MGLSLHLQYHLVIGIDGEMNPSLHYMWRLRNLLKQPTNRDNAAEHDLPAKGQVYNRDLNKANVQKRASTA